MALGWYYPDQCVGNLTANLRNVGTFLHRAGIFLWLFWFWLPDWSSAVQELRISCIAWSGHELGSTCFKWRQFLWLPVCLPRGRSLLKMGSTLKGMNLLPGKQILSFMRWPHFIWETTMKVIVAFPESVPIYLWLIGWLLRVWRPSQREGDRSEKW